MIHGRFSVLNPRSACAEGSAMFTMVASRTTINWATPMTARMSHWWVAAGVSPVGGSWRAVSAVGIRCVMATLRGGGRESRRPAGRASTP